MPIGTLVTTGVTPGSARLDDAPASTYFVAGLAERGSTLGAVLVRSLGESVALLGDRVAYGALYDDLQAFFAEGGSKAYVARVVGPAAAVGTRILVDRAGAPVNTLRADAASPGAWSAQLTVEVADGAVAGTYRIVVRHNGDVVEAAENLATPGDAVLAFANSRWIRVANLASATVAPNNNPAVTAATALSAGTDDRAAVAAADYVTALARFVPELGAGAVAVPGQASVAAVSSGLIAHARANRRLALLAPAVGTAVVAAGAAARALRPGAGAEFAGFFYPWIEVPSGTGGSRTISPEGYIAGVRARAHRSEGPHRAPAGDIATANWVVGTERDLTRAEVDTLSDDSVNAIRIFGSDLRLYGWRSLSVDAVNYRLLTARDVLNFLATACEERLERFVLRTIDGRGHLFNEVEAEMVEILEPLRLAGGLYERTNLEGQLVDLGYAVDTGPGVNTPESLAANELRVNIGVRVSPSAELVRLVLTKVAFRAELGA